MVTQDQAWRVEVVELNGAETVRFIHAGNIVEGLSLDEATMLLQRRGVDIHKLREVDPAA